MEPEAQRQLFKELGNIQGTLDAMKEDSQAQWKKMDSMDASYQTQFKGIDDRVRNQEKKHASLSGIVSLVVSVAVGLFTKGSGVDGA